MEDLGFPEFAGFFVEVEPEEAGICVFEFINLHIGIQDQICSMIIAECCDSCMHMLPSRAPDEVEETSLAADDAITFLRI